MILPCPHCHKTPEDKDPDTHEAAVVPTCYGRACVVQCNFCGLSGPIEDTVDAAISYWNELPRTEKKSVDPGDART